LRALGLNRRRRHRNALWLDRVSFLLNWFRVLGVFRPIELSRSSALKRHIVLATYFLDEANRPSARINAFKNFFNFRTRHPHFFQYIQRNVLSGEGVSVVLAKKVTENTRLQHRLALGEEIIAFLLGPQDATRE